jgi:hypothetical protein
MRFFKFIGEDNKSLCDIPDIEKIHYVKGKTIEVEDTDMNIKVQCGEGIHCILFDGTKPINTVNILFGPRVAILEADEEDVIYYSEDGKCRLKKCEVVDVYDINKLPKELKNGRGNQDFSIQVFKLLKYCKFSDCTELLEKNQYGNITQLLVKKLDRYYKKFEDYLVSNKIFIFAAEYALKHKKYYNNSIAEWVKTEGNNVVKLEWACTFGQNDIDKLEKEFLGELSNCSDYEFNCTVKYAIEFNRINDTIINFILRNKNINYYGEKLLFEYIRKFIDNPEIEKIAKLSQTYAYEYCVKKEGNVSDEVIEMIRGDWYYSVNYILNIKDDGFYDRFDDIYNIIAYLDKYGANDKFLDSILSLELKPHTGYVTDLAKFRTLKNSHKIDSIFIKLNPSFDECLKYTKYINTTSKIILKYIKQNLNIDYIMRFINYTGYVPQLGQILDEYNYSYDELPDIYFKVVKVLKNGTKVSPEIDKESGRKVYENSGKSIVVDEGMVFTNIFSAVDYYKTLSRDDDIRVYKCTGENFRLQNQTKKLDNDSIIHNELPGSGFLKNIQLLEESNFQLYF